MDPALMQFFSSLAPFTEEELRKQAVHFKPESLKKQEFFCKAGSLSDKLAFVKKGILRSFFYIKDKEITTYFQTPGTIAVALKSFVKNCPVQENIQVVQDAELLVISRSDLYQLYGEDWKWQQVGRKLIEHYYIHLEDRSITLKSLSAQERYIQFAASEPGVIPYVPLQYIASYLGISPETLSRIRKSL